MDLFLGLILIGIVISVALAYIKDNSQKKDSNPQNALHNTATTGTKGYDDVVRVEPKDDVEDRLYGMLEDIQNGRKVDFGNEGKRPDNILSSFRAMKMLKPDSSMGLGFLNERNGESDFCAIVVERLERFNASGYRMGLVKVVDGQISDTVQVDFRPIKLTKKLQKELGQEKVDKIMSAPDFFEVWSSVSHYFESQVVVTYDDSFESKVLEVNFEYYNIDFKPLCFLFANSKTQIRLQNLLDNSGIVLENGDCLTLAKIIAEIQLSDKQSDYLAWLKKKFWHKL